VAGKAVADMVVFGKAVADKAAAMFDDGTRDNDGGDDTLTGSTSPDKDRPPDKDSMEGNSSFEIHNNREATGTTVDIGLLQPSGRTAGCNPVLVKMNLFPSWSSSFFNILYIMLR
jgi:hypothetical protein